MPEKPSRTTAADEVGEHIDGEAVAVAHEAIVGIDFFGAIQRRADAERGQRVRGMGCRLSMGFTRSSALGFGPVNAFGYSASTTRML